MKNIVMIIAKGNSTRIPEKNIVDICGKPMLAYIIKIAQHARVSDDIVVSTDTDKAKRIALEHGATDVIMRKPEWDTDHVAGGYCLQKSVEAYEQRHNKKFDDCTMIAGNALFWRPSWIRVALDVLRNDKYRGSRITHVYPRNTGAGCMCVTLSCSSYVNPIRLGYWGIFIDIDYPNDLKTARQIMKGIQNGEIDHPLYDENIHEEKQRLDASFSTTKFINEGSMYP